MRLYEDLAWLWSEMTPSETYLEEALDLFLIASDALKRRPQSWVELGSGGGYLMEALLQQYPETDVTMVDVSSMMIAESTIRNPKATHICADMTQLRLEAVFDVVLLHDAVMYLQDRKSISEALNTIRQLLKPDGVAIIIPDVCRESFEERVLSSEVFGKRAHVHLTEWHWDPDPNDDFIQVDFSVLFREHQVGIIRAVHEAHTMVVLSIEAWMNMFIHSDLQQDFPSQPWMHGGEFFMLRPNSN